MTPEKKADLIRAAKQVQAEGAKDAGALSFMVRMLVLATLPHSNPGHTIGAVHDTPDIGL
jgi:hypothetical protein